MFLLVILNVGIDGRKSLSANYKISSTDFYAVLFFFNIFLLCFFWHLSYGNIADYNLRNLVEFGFTVLHFIFLEFSIICIKVYIFLLSSVCSLKS